jgi:hypothetical protein
MSPQVVLDQIVKSNISQRFLSESHRLWKAASSGLRMPNFARMSPQVLLDQIAKSNISQRLLSESRRLFDQIAKSNISQRFLSESRRLFDQIAKSKISQRFLSESRRLFDQIAKSKISQRLLSESRRLFDQIAKSNISQRLLSESRRLWKAATSGLCMPQKTTAWILVIIVALTLGVVLPQNCGKDRQLQASIERSRSVDKLAENDWVQQMMRFQAYAGQKENCEATESGELSDSFAIMPDVYETDEEVSGDIVRKRIFELEVVGKAEYDVSLHGHCRWLKVYNEKSTYKILLPFGADWDFREDSDTSLEDGILTVVARKGGNGVGILGD